MVWSCFVARLTAGVWLAVRATCNGEHSATRNQQLIIARVYHSATRRREQRRHNAVRSTDWDTSKVRVVRVYRFRGPKPPNPELYIAHPTTVAHSRRQAPKWRAWRPELPRKQALRGVHAQWGFYGPSNQKPRRSRCGHFHE